MATPQGCRLGYHTPRRASLPSTTQNHQVQVVAGTRRRQEQLRDKLQLKTTLVLIIQLNKTVCQYRFHAHGLLVGKLMSSRKGSLKQKSERFDNNISKRGAVPKGELQINKSESNRV